MYIDIKIGIYITCKSMAYTIYNNFGSFYYNILANFYLVVNIIMPYYDDVILTFQKEALNLYLQSNCDPDDEEDVVTFRQIKRRRLNEFIDDALTENIEKVIVHESCCDVTYVIKDENLNDTGSDSTSAAPENEDCIEEMDDNTSDADKKND